MIKERFILSPLRSQEYGMNLMRTAGKSNKFYKSTQEVMVNNTALGFTKSHIRDNTFPFNPPKSKQSKDKISDDGVH